MKKRTAKEILFNLQGKPRNSGRKKKPEEPAPPAGYFNTNTHGYELVPVPFMKGQHWA